MKVADLAAGVQLNGRFRLVKMIGRGSYGDVWMADVIDGSDLPAQVAIKIYQQPQQNRATQLLLKEAEIARYFDERHLVQVYGAERIDGLVVMWMEYVDGDSLLARLGPEDAPKPVSLDDAMSWLHNISEALAYLHSQDPPCIHGDLKLDNVLLDKVHGARLVDFGQSRFIEDRFVPTDGTGALPYLAPEVMGRGMEAEGKRYVASDIYALGVITFRLLTGRFPRRTLHEILNLTPFPQPSELNPSIPSSLDVLVLKCLEKRPENRYSTGATLLAAVDKARAEMREGLGAMPLPAVAGERLPTVAEELLDLTKGLVEAGKPEEAVTRLEQAMQRISTSPRILLLYAAAARMVGKLDAAHLVYQRAIRWLRSNGAGDEELRDPIEGKAELDVLLKHYEKAVDGYAWLVERWPEKRWYHFRHAVVLGLAGRYHDSLAVLLKLHEAGPPTALVCAKIGFVNLQLSNTGLATQYFNEALMLDEFEPVALYHMARIRAIQGQSDKANRYLARLKQVDGAEHDAQELEMMIHGQGRRVAE